MIKGRAEISLSFPSEKEAENFFACIKPEEKSIRDSTSETEIMLEKNRIRVKIAADSGSRLRAIAASYNRFLRIYEDINKVEV